MKCTKEKKIKDVTVAFFILFAISIWGTCNAASVSLSYQGMDSDVVGRGSQAIPNGQMDGHFSIMVDTHGKSEQVSYIVLHSSDRNGNPSSQVWDTNPNSYWILGVYRNGRRLNPTDHKIHDVVSGRIHYEIYGNDSGWFKSGQHFRVTVKFKNGEEAMAVTSIGASGGMANVSLSYRGMDADVVGKGSQGHPNDQMDGHFTVKLNLQNDSRIVKYIVLKSSDASGNPAGRQVWDTNPNSYWILGVYRNGRRLNPTDHKIYDAVSGSNHYEIYGNDSGWFKSGQYFSVTIQFEDGGEIKAVTVVR